MLKTYWTVKSGYGVTLYYDNYADAKEQSKYDYYDKPVKHTVKAETFNELEQMGAFYQPGK